MPRITNPDDDEQVEARKEALAVNAARREAAAEADRLGAAGADAAYAEVAANVETVLRNLEDEPPLKLKAAYVTCMDNPSKGLSKGAIVVLVNKDGHTETPDGKKLAELCGDELFGASDLLGNFIGRAGGLSKAMPDIVQAGVREGIVPAADAARLSKKFAGWMKGVGWGKCQLSHTNRPSLGSWNGWPWEATNELTSRALSVGLKGKVLDVVVEGAYCTPQQIYVGDKHQLFVPIWTSSGGKLLGGEAAITKAIAEYHRLVKK